MKILSILFILSNLLLARAATITGLIQDTTGAALTNSRVIFQPLGRPGVNGGALLTSLAGSVTTSSTGTFTNSLAPGDYTVVVGGRDRFTISVPNDSSTNSLVDLISTALQYTYTVPPSVYPVATTVRSGTARTDSTVADPVVYLSTTVDSLLASAAGNLTTVSNSVLAALPKAGGTMTGTVVFAGGQPTATTSAANIVQLSSATNSTSATLAATPAAVKLVYDAAIAAAGASGGTATNAISITNGTGVAVTLNQINSTNFPILVKSDYYATNHSFVIGNGYTAGGTGGSYPIAHFRPTTYGDSMPFDLMPNGTNADVWMDLCADDITPSGLGGNGGANLNFLDIRHRSIANGNVAIIATDAWGSRSYGDLRLQVNGGNLLVGPFSGGMDKHYTWAKTNFFSPDHFGTLSRFAQFRPATNVNAGIDDAGGALVLDAFDDSGTLINVRHHAAKTLFSVDSFGTAYLPFAIRPTTNFNLGIDTNAGALRMTFFNDSATVVPGVISASSLAVTPDNVNYPLIVSNNVVSATTLAATTRETVGAVVPSNRSSVASFENLMGASGNSTANFQVFGGNGGLYVLSAAGTPASPTPSTAANLVRFAGLGLDTAGSTNWFIGANVELIPTGTWGASDHGMTAGFAATPSGTTTRVVNVMDTGAAMSVSSGTATTPAASAVLDLQSTTTGLLPPRMTKVQRNAISSPANGLVVYQTDSTPGLRAYENGAWVKYTATADP